MNKYLIAGYAISFVVALLISKHRKLLFSRHFIIGTFLGLVIVIPNLIWQYSHNWPVMHHLSELARNQLVNVSVSGFLIDQIIMNFHAVVVWITGLLIFLFYLSERKFRVLSIASLFVILFLLITKGKSYYTLGAYTLMMAMGGYAIERYYSKIWKSVVIVLMVLLSIPIMPFSLPVLNLAAMEKYAAPVADVTNRWEDGEVHPLPQDYADMTGWKDLSKIVISTYTSLPNDIRQNCSIYAENYGQAGAILFYGKKFGLPQPVSFSDNFLLWAPDSIIHENLIYVNDEVGDINKLFNNVELKGEIKNPYFRENGVKVFFCSQPSDIFKSFYKEKVSELKSVYRRKKNQ